MQGQREQRSKLMLVGSIGTTLVAATALGFAAGYYADAWLGTSPWFTLIMFVLGLAAGILGVIREVRKLS